MSKTFPNGIWAIASHCEEKSDVESFILRTQGAAARTWRRPQMSGNVIEESLLSLVGAGKLFCHGQFDWSLAVDAAGTICGAYSLPIRVVKEKVTPGFLIGASVHSLSESKEALAAGSDFLIFGPIWETPSKAKFMPARGLDGLHEVIALGVPVIAIGGIQEASQIHEIRKLNAAGAAVLSACTEAERFQSLVDAWSID